jgi:hypothetical protein
LREQLEKANELLGNIKDLSNITLDESYLIETTVRFREKNRQPRSKLSWLWAKAFAPALALVFGIVVLFTSVDIPTNVSLESIIGSVDLSSDISMIEEYTGISYENEIFNSEELTAHPIDETLASALTIPGEYETDVYETMADDYDEIIYSLSDEEIDALYNELENENPLRGVQ